MNEPKEKDKKSFLEKLKYKVIETSNGKEAVDIFLKNNQKFSLITKDYNMPILNGVEVIKAIRKQDKNIPIIGITASAQIMRQELKHENDMTILSKPIDESELKTIISELS
jgi:CheY-like chemotaxis protein